MSKVVSLRFILAFRNFADVPKNWYFQNKQVTIIERFFFVKPYIAKLMYDTAYIEITYWKRLHNYVDTSEGSILNVRPSEGFGILIRIS